MRTFSFQRSGLQSANQKVLNLDPFVGLQALIDKDDENKDDILVPLSKVDFTEDKTLALPHTGGTGLFAFSDLAFNQLCAHLKIPARYLRTCHVTGPGGMQAQVQARMEPLAAKEFLFRVRRVEGEHTNGIVRAVLSSNYSPFDNRHLLDAARRAMKTVGFQLKEHNAMHMQSFRETFTFRGLMKAPLDLAGDAHRMGFAATTSEVGGSNATIASVLYRLLCSNGLMGWAEDAELASVRHVNVTVNEVNAKLEEGIHASTLLGEAAGEVLSQLLDTPVHNPELAIHTISDRLKLSDEMTTRTLTAWKETAAENQGNKYYVMQAFTRAVNGEPLAVRNELEERIGQFFIMGKIGRSKAVIDTTAEEAPEAGDAER